MLQNQPCVLRVLSSLWVSFPDLENISDLYHRIVVGARRFSLPFHWPLEFGWQFQFFMWLQIKCIDMVILNIISIAGSALAQRHKNVHCVSNARLLVDASRRALGELEHSLEYRSFRKDIEKEICVSRDGDESIRYSRDGDETVRPCALLMNCFPYFMAARTWHC